MKRSGKNKRQSDPRGRKVGLPRFLRQDWPRWLESVRDRDRWEETFDDWEQAAEAMADRLRSAGLEVIWVDVPIDTFARWAEAGGHGNDSEARSRYAAEQVGNIPPSPRHAGPT